MFALIWILVGVMGRLVIHIPDVTPITSLCLLSPVVFSKKTSLIILIFILLLSDFCLHCLFHYPIFGLWTIFTYSGWLGVLCLGFLFSNNLNLSRAFYFTCIGSFVFWIWTNLGTWITTNLYSHHFHGLLQCYIAALPFLRNSMVGSIVWTGVLTIFIFQKKYESNLKKIVDF